MSERIDKLHAIAQRAIYDESDNESDDALAQLAALAERGERAEELLKVTTELLLCLSEEETEFSLNLVNKAISLQTKIDAFIADKERNET